MNKRFVSQEWELGPIGHANYDFVDVNVIGDNLLFIDPCRIEQSKSPLAERCTDVMKSFFDALYSAYRANDYNQKHYILSHATEENSTHLGYGHPGKGNRADNLIEMFAPLDELICSIPTISEAQDLPVLIEGFAEDGMSDLLTNILHFELNQYTIEQLQRFGKHPNDTKQFFFWNAMEQNWMLSDNHPCYSYRGNPIMLVPKCFVRRCYLFSTSQYLERIIVERIRSEGEGYDSDGNPIPKRYYLEHCIPHDTENWRYQEAIRYSTVHPDALTEYHRRLPTFYFDNGQCMDDADIDLIIYG